MAEQHQPAVVEAHPDAPGAVLENGVRFVTGQTLALAIHGKEVVAQPGESAASANPKIAFAIVQETIDDVAVASGAAGRDETAALQARQPAVSSEPDVTVAILAEGAHEQIGQAVAGAVVAHGPRR